MLGNNNRVISIGTLKKIKDSGTIVLGHRDASTPFSSLGTEPGKPVGYSHDIQLKVVEAIKKELALPDLKVRYNLVTSQTRIPLVQNGTVEIGNTALYYYWGKNPAFTFGTALPFGLNSRQMNSWLRHGGGTLTGGPLSYADLALFLQLWELLEEDVIVHHSESAFLGRGSFGAVYRAEFLGSDAAVKLIKYSADEAIAMDGFAQEVALMTKLHHPNIVQFLGYARTPALTLVIELFPEGSVERFVPREKPGQKTSLRFCIDMALAIEYLHSRQPSIVIHRC